MPEAIWAVLGAFALVIFAFVPLHDAVLAVGRGTDVYLFLIGMMLLAELARCEGLFDWLAAHAARSARGSATRLFSLIYLVGIAVTTFLSNDATAVVLTPAVYAAAKAAQAKPLPYLFICAFIANAASFVLPISNPANLVFYDNHMPALGPWLRQFALPSILAIGSTYVSLRLIYRNQLKGAIATNIAVPDLSAEGRYTAYGIGLTAVALMLASANDVELGAPAFACGAITAAAVLLKKREIPWRLFTGVSWEILPLVAGLFVIVAGLKNTGVVAQLAALLQWSIQQSATAAAWGAGAGLAFVTNLMNNLTAGLIAEAVVSSANAPPVVTGALLIGVDLGPNLSVTGSLATILWLVALRRDGVQVTGGYFLRIGVFTMIPALVLALGALILQAR
jgi:arsenical pump membrane protein